MSYYKDTESCEETIYRIAHNLDKKPKCKTCGKPLKFNHGFPTFCSKKCSNADPEVLKKNRINVSKDLTEAYKERGDEIKEKRMHTLQERYDTDVSTSSPFGIKAIRDKMSDK